MLRSSTERGATMRFQPSSIVYWVVVGILTVALFPFGLIILALSLIATGVGMRRRALNAPARQDGTNTLVAGIATLGVLVFVVVLMVFWSASSYESDGDESSSRPTPVVVRHTPEPAG